MAAEPIRSRVGKLAVGLAVDCDAPVDGIDDLLHENLPDASMLPFVGVLTYEGKWVGGYSGFRQPPEFGAFLDEIEKSPLLDAKPDVRAQLAKHAKAATDAAEKGNWGAVVKAVRAADACFGRCPERDALRTAEQRVRDWLAAQYDAVTKAAVSGDDLAAARRTLADVKRVFAGEPEADDAQRGLEALSRLNRVRAVEAQGNAKKDLRDRAAAEFAGTRWTALFTRAGDAPKPAEPAKDKGSGKQSG